MANHLETDVDIQENTILLQDQAGVETGPDLNLVSLEDLLLGLVELLAANLLEPERTHHRVEEDLQEVEVIFVSRLHDLDPLNFDRVLSALDFGSQLGYVAALAVRVDAVSPLDVELDLLFDLVPHSLEDGSLEL